MEGHQRLAQAHFPVISFGTGSLVRLPGPAITQPNVYQFNKTSYDSIYRELEAKDPRLYRANGVLNMIGRNQQFSQFLISDNWLDTLANASNHPEEVLAGLDRYLDKYIQNTVHHFQMRQFIAFYAVAQNLEPLLLSIREAELSTGPIAFNTALAPKTNPSLMGTGIEAPPLTGMLGVGSCHLFRELYRLGRLKNTSGYRLAFTPIRKVRRLCQIFGIPEGSASLAAAEIIFKRLSDLAVPLGLDPTFNRCFDLPLQFLAEDARLRSEVLKATFEIDSADDNVDGFSLGDVT